MNKIRGNVVGTNMSVDRIAERIGASAVYNVNVEASGKIYDTFYNISNAYFSGKVVTLTDNSEVNTLVYLCTGASSEASPVLWFTYLKGDPTTAGGGTVTIRGLQRLNDDSCLLLPVETYSLSNTGGSVELDTTLSVSGKAADAKAVGDAIGDIDSALDSIIAEQEAIIAIQEALIGGDAS